MVRIFRPTGPKLLSKKKTKLFNTKSIIQATYLAFSAILLLSVLQRFKAILRLTSSPLQAFVSPLDNVNPNTNIFNCDNPIHGRCKYFYPSKFFSGKEPGSKFAHIYDKLEELRRQRKLWLHMPKILLLTMKCGEKREKKERRSTFKFRHKVTFIHVHKVGGTSIHFQADRAILKNGGMVDRYLVFSPRDPKMEKNMIERPRHRNLMRKPDTMPGGFQPPPGMMRPNMLPGMMRPDMLPGMMRPDMPPGMMRPDMPFMPPGKMRPDMPPDMFRPDRIQPDLRGTKNKLSPPGEAYDYSVTYEHIKAAVKYKATPDEWTEKDHVIFAFIRDPLDRFISSIGQAMGGQGSGRNKIGPLLMEKCISTPKYSLESSRFTLQCMIDYVKENGFFFEVHFTPQAIEVGFSTQMLPVPVAIFPYKEAYKDVMIELGMDPDSTARDGDTNGHRPHPVLTDMTSKDYTEDMKRQVCELYEVDIIMFRTLGFPMSSCDAYV